MKKITFKPSSSFPWHLRKIPCLPIVVGGFLGFLLSKFDKTHTTHSPIIIYGSNPFLNVFLAWRLSLNTHYKKIIVITTAHKETYNYNLLKTDTFWSFLSKHIDTYHTDNIQSLLLKLIQITRQRVDIHFIFEDVYIQDVRQHQEHTWLRLLPTNEQLKQPPDASSASHESFIQIIKDSQSVQIKKKYKDTYISRTVKNKIKYFQFDDRVLCFFAEQLYLTSKVPLSASLSQKIKTTNFGNGLMHSQHAYDFYKQPFFDVESILNIRDEP